MSNNTAESKNINWAAIANSMYECSACKGEGIIKASKASTDYSTESNLCHWCDGKGFFSTFNPDK